MPKAQEFIDKYCPKGAVAQQDGLVDFPPVAVGSYKEVVDHPVSPLSAGYNMIEKRCR